VTKSYQTIHILSVALVLWAGSLGASSPALTFLTPDLEIEPQFFSAVQGPDHLLYLGSTEAVLRFDGSRWTRIETPGHTTVRSLRRDSRGRIWVGGYNAFGYLQRQPTGADILVDLSAAFQADLGETKFTDIWSKPTARFFFKRCAIFSASTSTAGARIFGSIQVDSPTLAFSMGGSSYSGAIKASKRSPVAFSSPCPEPRSSSPKGSAV
jgi:hypothetical protein